MAATVIRSLLLSASLTVNGAFVCIIINLHQQRHNDARNYFQKLNSSVLFQL